MLYLGQLRYLLYAKRKYYRTRHRLVHGYLRGYIPTYLFLLAILERGYPARGLGQLMGRRLGQFIRMLFLHKAEAAPVGLCKALFGQDVLIDVYPWHAIDPILFALPLSAITIVLVSLATQKKVF